MASEFGKIVLSKNNVYKINYIPIEKYKKYNKLKWNISIIFSSPQNIKHLGTNFINNMQDVYNKIYEILLSLNM